MLVPYEVINEDNCWSGVSSVKKHINKELSSFCKGQTPVAQETLFTCILYLTFWKSSFWLRVLSNDTHTTIFAQKSYHSYAKSNLLPVSHVQKKRTFFKKVTSETVILNANRHFIHSPLILLMLTEKIQLLNWACKNSFWNKKMSIWNKKMSMHDTSCKRASLRWGMNNHHGNCLLLHKLLLHQN